jgi:hypothetical protein
MTEMPFCLLRSPIKSAEEMPPVTKLLLRRIAYTVGIALPCGSCRGPRRRHAAGTGAAGFRAGVHLVLIRSPTGIAIPGATGNETGNCHNDH